MKSKYTHLSYNILKYIYNVQQHGDKPPTVAWVSEGATKDKDKK